MEQAAPPVGGSLPGPSGGKLLGLAGLALVAFIAVAWAGFSPRWRLQARLAASTRELAVSTVGWVTPARGKSPPGLLVPAELRPWQETPIYARASGYVKRWLVDLGEQVEAGQLLAELETPELVQELERARQELAQAQASMALAKLTAGRSARLAKSQTINGDENDRQQAELAVKTAMARAAAANVRRLEELQSFARVTAPFPGVITARNIDVGELVSSGRASEMFRLAQVDRLRVYIRVPQRLATAVAPGQSAELFLPEQPKRVFLAKVVRTAGVVSIDSRTLLTELSLDNTGHGLLPGSFAQVRLVETKGVEALTVPSNTLLFRAEGPQVGVVREDQTVELRTLKLGRDFGQTLEVLSGLVPADRVILNPSDSLVAGTTVRLAERPKAESGKAASSKPDSGKPEKPR
jgi:RND family efflux transporter MFP subunit